MARRVAARSAAEVRALIAQAVLDTESEPVSLAKVRLHEHQRSAVTLLRRSVRRHGGALLADAVGLGKTYVALALAREYSNPLVVAPAVLHAGWATAAERAGVRISFVSTESLSRDSPSVHPDLVVVDEAHHFRNPATQRYARLARLVARTPVLLISATPVHNRRSDLTAILALFLGSRAGSLSDSQLGSCIVRREHRDVPRFRLPRLSRTIRIEIAADADVLEGMLSLPEPFPLREGRVPTALIQLGLAHMWTSSDAAFLAGCRRRIARSGAIRDSLAIGRVPSRGELASWCVDDVGTQLGFAELLVKPESIPTADGIAQLDRHVTALRNLVRRVTASVPRDPERVAALRSLMKAHHGERIVAFSAYADTVHAFFRQLNPAGEVAAVTGSGGRIASGRCSAEEVLRTFRDPRHERERIRLLLASDLLSEGVNLPEAAVVVHLDLPWTAARLEQRTGRLRRLDSTVPEVRAYAFTQPRAIERRLGKELLLARKARLASESIGSLNGASGDDGGPSTVRATELIRQQARAWLSLGEAEPSVAVTRHVSVAATWSERCGFLAAVKDETGIRLLAGTTKDSGLMTATRDPHCVCNVMRSAAGDDAPVTARQYRTARRAIAASLRTHSITRSLGERPLPPSMQRLLDRLNGAVLASPSHVRAATARRVSRLRSALAARLPVGTELALQQAVAHLPDAGLVSAMEAVVLPETVSPGACAPEVLAVLLLEKLAGSPGR